MREFERRQENSFSMMFKLGALIHLPCSLINSHSIKSSKLTLCLVNAATESSKWRSNRNAVTRDWFTAAAPSSALPQ